MFVSSLLFGQGDGNKHASRAEITTKLKRTIDGGMHGFRVTWIFWGQPQD